MNLSSSITSRSRAINIRNVSTYHLTRRTLDQEDAGPGLVDWWIGGLVDWWIGGLVD